MNPFFSVVISVYNKERHIANTIQSVLNQTFKDFEIIIVNDGSSDNSLKIINQFNGSKIQLINHSNHGASFTRNKGIKAAKGKFIALLDGDDLWDSHFLEIIREAIKSYPNESVFTSAIAHKYDSKIVPVKYCFDLNHKVKVLNYFEASKSHSALSGSSTVFKKDILNLTGDFDITIASGQDTDLWVRFGIHYPIVFVCKVLVFYIYNSSSLSNTTYKIDAKPKFNKYRAEEIKNKSLKEFLDKNRFSLAILSKLNNDKISYYYYKNALSLENLNLKRKILITSPKWILLILLKIKSLKGEKLYYKPL